MSSVVHNRNIVIDPEFKNRIRRLDDDEYAQLEANILADGCREPLVVWRGKNILVDGHNRYEICNRHGLPFEVIEKEFDCREAVLVWIIENQLGRRNLPEPERIKYALELKPAIAALAEARMKAGTKQDPVSNLTQGKTRDALADKAGVSIGKFYYAETLLTKAPDFLREWYETGVVTAHGGYQLYKALEGAHEDVVAVVAKWQVVDHNTIPLLIKQHNRGSETWQEIRDSGYVQPGEEYEAVSVTAGAKAVADAIALKAQIHKQLKGDEKLQARVESVKDIAPAFDDYRHGDCLQLLPSLPPRSVRLLLTDPPYGIGFQSNWRTVSARAPKLINDETPEKAIALFRAMLSSVSPAMADECHALIFTSWRYEPQFRTALEEAGFEIAASIVWVKENHGSGDLSGFAPMHERILHARRGGAAIRPRLEDVLIVPRERATDHPTEKPTALLEQLIACTTLEGELVVDPFAGAGSTVVAARRLGRKVFAVELDARWHAAGIERLVKEGIHAVS